MAFLMQEVWDTKHNSVVGHLQFSSGMDDPNIPEIPRVELVVRGFKGCRGPAYEATTPKYSRYPTKDPWQMEEVQSGISTNVLFASMHLCV